MSSVARVRLTQPLFETRGDAEEVLGSNPILSFAMTRRLFTLPLVAILAGPALLSAIYAFMISAEGIEGRGLTSFASATIGDWLLLPIVVALSALAMRDLGRMGLGRLSGAWLPLPFVWSVVSSVALNWLWLSDSANVNWTQPVGPGPFGTPLWFNAAGWVHAAFFVMMQWWIAEFVFRFAVAMWKMHAASAAVDSEQGSRLLVEVNGILAVSMVFGVLLARDYWDIVVAASSVRNLVWLIVPVVVLCISAVTNTVLFKRLSAATTVAGRESVWRRQGVVLVIWSVPLSVVSIVLIYATVVDVFGAFQLLPLASVALALLGSANVYAETYHFQRGRTADRIGVVTIFAVGMTLLAGFMVSLDMLLSQPLWDTFQAVVLPWLGAFGVAIAATAGAAGLGVMLADREMLNPDGKGNRTKRCDCAEMNCSCVKFYGQEPPQHDILQNVFQFGLLHGLLPMFAASYILQALPMLSHLGTESQLSTHIALMFGYAGVVVAAVTFPLYNNMQYVRELEAALKHERDGGDKRETEYLNADKSFTTGLTIIVGVIAALAAMWMWISVLDVVLTNP